MGMEAIHLSLSDSEFSGDSRVLSGDSTGIFCLASPLTRSTREGSVLLSGLEFCE